MEPTEEQREWRVALDEVADRVRSPQLSLGKFALHVPEEVGEDEDLDAGAWLVDAERADARLRRGAVMLAAVTIVDECFDDLGDQEAGDGEEADAVAPSQTFAYRFFPPRFQRHYDERFARKVTATACKVAADLSDPHSGPPACIAEEILLSAIIHYAKRIMDAAGLGEPWMSLEDMLLEDLDVELLYDADMDGLEDDPAAQRAMGMSVPGVNDWFSPFSPHRFPHPYVETKRSSPREHVLPTVFPDDPAAVVFDDPAPLTGLTAGSEVVRMARAAAAADLDQATWVADASDPEGSFAALVDALTSTGGSGWLTWEPHEDADIVRTDGAVRGTAHRHYPEPDVPWLNITFGQVYMSIPLTHVVSFRPDAEVAQAWQDRFKAFFNGLGND